MPTRSFSLGALLWAACGCAKATDPASPSADSTGGSRGGLAAGAMTSGGSHATSAGATSRGGRGFGETVAGAGGADRTASFGGTGELGGSGGVRWQPPPLGPMDVVFTPSAGTFVSSVTIALQVQNKDARVHYTLDGSLPSAASPVYDKPLELKQSTRIRSVAIAPNDTGGLKGAVGAATYLRVASDAARFTSHLPILVIETFESGVLDPQGDVFVPAVLQVLEPAGLSTSLVGRATLDTRIGIHVRGESSRGFDKKQYAVEFWGGGADEDVDLPLLGMPPASDWVISDPLPPDRTMIRNAFVYALTNRLGRYAPRTRFAEVYLVDNAGEVSSTHFLGFYTVIEKIKRGPGRVELSKLAPADLMEPDITGGYIVRIDPGLFDFKAGGRGLQFVYPDAEVMMAPERLPQVNYIQAYIENFYQATVASDHKHPATGRHYSEFIDQESWIDLHIINNLAKNPDTTRRSMFFHKNKAGRLVAGPVWDFDRTLGTPNDERATDPVGWVSFEENWWRALFADPTFRAAYRARFLELLRTQFIPEVYDPIIDELARTVGLAADRNYARWPRFRPQPGGHAAEIAIMKDFLRKRTAWIKTQLETLEDFRPPDTEDPETP